MAKGTALPVLTSALVAERRSGSPSPGRKLELSMEEPEPEPVAASSSHLSSNVSEIESFLRPPRKRRLLAGGRPFTDEDGSKLSMLVEP